MFCRTRLLFNFGQSNVLRKSPKVVSSLRDRRYYNKNSAKDVENIKIDNEASPFSKFVEPYPIDGLNIVNHLEKIDKPGSIFNQYIAKKFDKDLLNFPFLLSKREEFLKLNEQYEMIRSSFYRISKDEETLKALGYKSLHNLTISEMVNAFEAIGASIQKQLCFGTREDDEIRREKKMSRTLGVNYQENALQVPETAFQSFHSGRMNLQAVIPLLIHNAIVQYAAHISTNEELKNKLLKDGNKVGFAVCESHVHHSSDFAEWKSEANLTYDNTSWVINGQKDNVLAGDFDHYLICLRTINFLEKQKFDGKEAEGVVMLLVSKEQLEFDDDYEDMFGIKYQKISFKNIKIDRSSGELVGPGKDALDFLNTKSCGLMATSAVMVGLMKQLLKNTYAHLINEKLGLVNCELVQYKLYQATARIYAMESMLYLTAAMYDCFEKGAKFEGEVAAIKVLSAEYSYEIIQTLRSIYGSRYPFMTTSLDLVTSLDSLFETSLQTRLRLGESSIRFYQTTPYFLDKQSRFFTAPVYKVMEYLRYRKLRNQSDVLPKEMNKFVHPHFEEVCDWVESCMNRLEFSTNSVLNQHKFETMKRHIDLNRIATVHMDIFKMIAMLSRANHSVCYGLPNNDAEKQLCIAICKETFLNHLQMFEDMLHRTMSDNDDFARNVFAENLKANGYFASLFRSE